eukprot:m51a1_g9915 hypothetical protein (307) ;mRNA; f:134499-135669
MARQQQPQSDTPPPCAPQPSASPLRYVPARSPAAPCDRIGRRPLPLWVLGLVACGACAGLWGLWAAAPVLAPEHRAKLRLPRSVADVQDISQALGHYTDSNFCSVALLFSACYVFLQAFSIPGSVFLSILAGALFDMWVGLGLVLVSATIGASGAYAISYFITHRAVAGMFPGRLKLLQKEVSKHREHIFYYLLFLRITPFLPNWFINLATPILAVPLGPFVAATFLGIFPATFLCVRAGLTLAELQRPSDAVDTRALATMAVLAVLSILPTLAPVRRAIGCAFTLLTGHQTTPFTFTPMQSPKPD